MNTYYPDTKTLIVKEQEGSTSLITSEPRKYGEFSLSRQFNKSHADLWSIKSEIKAASKAIDRYKEVNSDKEGSQGYEDGLSELIRGWSILVKKESALLESTGFDTYAQLSEALSNWESKSYGWKCKECGGQSRVGVQYSWDSPHHYDGISEWKCLDCDTRYCRRTDVILKENEVAKMYGGAVSL